MNHVTFKSPLPWQIHHWGDGLHSTSAEPRNDCVEEWVENLWLYWPDMRPVDHGMNQFMYLHPLDEMYHVDSTTHWRISGFDSRFS